MEGLQQSNLYSRSVQDAQQILQNTHTRKQSQAVQPEQTRPVEQMAEQPVKKASAPKKLAPLPYQEIQQVAKDAGFVGISDYDIHRAYAMGESLLVDYRV